MNLIKKLMKRSGFFEKADSTPTGIPVNFRRPPTLQEQVAAMLNSHQFKQQMEAAGYETIDEAEDFEVGDDYTPEAPHELVWDEDLEKEIPKSEKRILDRERAEFDAHLKRELAKQRKAQQKAKRDKAFSDAADVPEKDDSDSSES